LDFTVARPSRAEQTLGCNPENGATRFNGALERLAIHASRKPTDKDLASFRDSPSRFSCEGEPRGT